jgi:hypothetical protein
VVDLAHQCSRHQLVDLDVCLLNLSSQNVFDLLLILHDKFLRGWSSVIGNLLLLLDLVLPLNLLKIWNVGFDGEGDYTSSNLDSLSHFRFKFDRALSKYKSSKLGKVVLQIESSIVFVVLDESVTATYRNVRDSHIAFMSTAKLEDFLVSLRHDKMNHPRAVLFKSE